MAKRAQEAATPKTEQQQLQDWLSKGTSVVQWVFSSVELEVQNPTEFKKEFLRPKSIR